MTGSERIFVALDTPEIDRARQLVGSLRGHVGGFKIGLELFVSCGPEIVREVRDEGYELFCDLKLHDIPNTVAGAAAAVARLGVGFFTLHASGGPRMIAAGVDAATATAAEAGLPEPTALVVTVLTSHDDRELEQIGLAGPCPAAVARLATMARDAGAGGLVCSPLEVTTVREIFPEAILVVPGIRPRTGGSVAADDQLRTMTPAAAIARGADRLVIGRPITRAEDPRAAADAIAAEIDAG